MWEMRLAAALEGDDRSSRGEGEGIGSVRRLPREH